VDLSQNNKEPRNKSIKGSFKAEKSPSKYDRSKYVNHNSPNNPSKHQLNLKR